MILCSQDFSQEITATVLWLREGSIDISCVKITPYKVDEKIIIVPKVVIPLEEAKQYLIEIKRKEEVKEQSERTNRQKTMNILIENGLLHEGDEIFLKSSLPSYIEYEDGNPIFKATITGKLGQKNAVKWAVDGKEYAISALAENIFTDLHPEKKKPSSVNGNWYWANKDGKSLWKMAEDYLVMLPWRARVSEMIAEGKYSRKQILETVMAEMPTATTQSTLYTFLTDCKNPKYNRLAKLTTEKDGIMRFVETASDETEG